MSVKAASASARIASCGTTSTSSPSTRSTRTPSAAILRYGVKSLPSGNSGVCLYGGVGWAVRGAFMCVYRCEDVRSQIARLGAIYQTVERRGGAAWLSPHHRQRDLVNLRFRIAELRQDGEVVFVRYVERFDTDVGGAEERGIALHHVMEQARFLRAGDEKTRRHAGADQVDRIPLLVGFDGEFGLLLEAGRPQMARYHRSR